MQEGHYLRDLVTLNLMPFFKKQANVSRQVKLLSLIAETRKQSEAASLASSRDTRPFSQQKTGGRRGENVVMRSLLESGYLSIDKLLELNTSWLEEAPKSRQVSMSRQQARSTLKQSFQQESARKKEKRHTLISRKRSKKPEVMTPDQECCCGREGQLCVVHGRHILAMSVIKGKRRVSTTRTKRPAKKAPRVAGLEQYFEEVDVRSQQTL